MKRLTSSLKNEIIQTVKNKERYTAYFSIVFFVINENFHSGWQTDKIVRLFRKKSNYSLQKNSFMKSYTLMEKREIEEQTNSLFLYQLLYLQEKMISYGKLKANEEFTKGTKPNFSISTSSFLPIHKSIHTEIRSP
jgi:hypothetical protein